MRALRIVLLAATLVLLGAGVASALPVLGFQSDGSPTRLIAGDAPGLALVGVDGVNLSGAPGAVDPMGADDHAQLAAAHAADRPAVLLVGNYSGAIGDFSEALAWRTQRSPAATAAAARTLASDVVAGGWDGVSVDFESLRRRDGPGLVRFLTDLRAGIGPDRSLTDCVQLQMTPGGYAAIGYDLPAMAPQVSQLVLMAYDEHGPWEATPGPVGATPWVERGVRAALTLVPASTVDLGVGGYGYEWGPRHRAQLSDAAARALAGPSARWVPRDDEWTARLPGHRTLWWSDARTLASRQALAASLGLHGLAVWSLGLSDSI